jgi:hypothetical protein
LFSISGHMILLLTRPMVVLVVISLVSGVMPETNSE